MQNVLMLSVLIGGGLLAKSQLDSKARQVGSAPTVRIEEVLAVNRQLVADEAGQFEDYILLSNPTDQPIDVGGMYLSDDWDEPRRWRIPNGHEIPAHSHLRIWADEQLTDGPLHACFKLSGTGEKVMLFDIDARQNVMIDGVVFRSQRPDQPLRRTDMMHLGK